MTRDEAENLIRQAEIRVENLGIGSGRRHFFGSINDLVRLIDLAVMHERQECAQYAENYDLGTPDGHEIARAIRQRNDAVEGAKNGQG